MAFHTFGPGLALDRITMRGIPATAATLEDAETGDSVQAYTMDDVPIETSVFTNRYGYYGQFKTDASVRRLRLTFGELTLENAAWELLLDTISSTEDIVRLGGMLATRGPILQPTDANAMRGVEWVGDWAIFHHDVTNGPPLAAGIDTLWLVKIRMGNTNFVEQVWESIGGGAHWRRISKSVTEWAPYHIPHWDKGKVTPELYPTLDDVPSGFTEIWTAADAAAYGLPVHQVGTLQKFAYGSVQHITFLANVNGTMRSFATSKPIGAPAVWAETTWKIGRVTSAEYPTLDEVPEGYSQVWSGGDATAWGLPVIQVGTLTKHSYGSVQHITFLVKDGGKMRLYATSKPAGQPAEWTEIGAAPDPSNMVGLMPATSNGFKAVGVPCSLGRSVGTTTGQGFARLLQQMPASATRARVRIRNINPRFETADSDPMTLTNVSIGFRPPNADNSDNWVTVAASGSTGTEGYVSPWIQVPADMLDSQVLVGFGWECAGTVQKTLATVYTGNSAADALTGAGTRGTEAPGFVTLEVEVPNTTPVVAVFGDSIASGIGATAPVYYSWLDQWAMGKGIVATHWSHSGDTASTWQDPTSPKWSLYGNGIAAADAVLYAMGSNDMFQTPTPTLAQMQERTRTAVEIMRRMISPNIYGVTVTPRDGVTGAAEDLRRQYNAWMPESGLFRDVFDVVPTVSDDNETLKPEFTSDGIHMNNAGYVAMGTAINRPIVTGAV